MTSPEAYVQSVVAVCQRLVGEPLTAAWIAGSLATDDFAVESSDVDLFVVTPNRLSQETKQGLAQGLDHAVLPCPAHGLDLLIYRKEAVEQIARAPEYEFSISTGIEWETDVSMGEAYPGGLIDLALSRRRGRSLLGLDPRELIGPIPERWVVEELWASLRWHIDKVHDPFHDPTGGNAVLNACRALHYLSARELVSKRAGAEWLLGTRSVPVVAEALRVRGHRPAAALDHAQVVAFLDEAIAEFEANVTPRSPVPTGAQPLYHRGLYELDQYLFHLDETALPRAVDAFLGATALGPDAAEHWVALGYSLDAADKPGEAITALRRALEVDPADEEVEVFILTLQSELGPEREALAAVEAFAKRTGVDLASLRRDLGDADMPVDARTLLLNGFLRARNFVRSRLQDVIERSNRRRNPGEWALQAEAERRTCDEMRDELADTIDPDQVPAELRPVTPWAIRLGVGDDVCRGTLVERLSPGDRSALLAAVREHATSIHAWLDAFGDEPMTPEAAAFMYLLLGVEEMTG